MSEFKRGALAGVYAGVVLGIALFSVPPWGWESLVGALTNLFLSIISKGFAGVVLAIIFLIIYDFLPADKVWKNGILYSVLLWLVFYIGAAAAFGWTESLVKYFVFITINLPPMLLFGYILGFVYEKLEEEREEELNEFMEKVRS